MKGRIYLDHNATAPPAPGIPELLATLWSANWGNPSSSHAEGRRARALLEEARERVARAAGASRGAVVFCSGGSESDALALRGLLDSGAAGALVVGELEHPAVADTALWLGRSRGVPLAVARATTDGVVPAEAVGEALRGARRALVSVMLAQNEIGTLNDIPAIAEVAHRAGALLHVDAVQALGKIPLSFDDLGADLLSISSHKIGGPPGIGALIARRGLDPVPFCSGGGQEGGLRPGTEALPLAVAFGAAAEGIAARVAAGAAIAALRDRLEGEIVAHLPGTRIAGARAQRLPNTAALLFAGVSGRALVAACDARGVAVSSGSACHSGGGGASQVVRALGVGEAWQQGLVRVSLGPETAGAEIDRAIDVLVEAVREAA